MAAMWQSGSNFGKSQIFILLLLLFWRYEVLGASIGASADEAFGVGEDAAKRRNVAAGEGRAGLAFHGCEDDGGCHILTFVVAGRVQSRIQCIAQHLDFAVAGVVPHVLYKLAQRDELSGLPVPPAGLDSSNHG